MTRESKTFLPVIISIVLTLGITGQVFGATNTCPATQSIVDTSINSTIKAVPAQMKPGTIIEYDKNIQLILVQDGYKGKDSKDVVLDKTVASKVPANAVKTPLPQSGMKVYYDGLGEPIKITIDGVIYSDKTSFDIKASTASTSSTYTSPAGGVTWYTDDIGMYDNTLVYHDCATDMYSDNCARDTQIRLTCTSTGRLAYFNKNDIGNLQYYGHILDLRPAAFQDYGFDLSTGVFQARYVHS
ncbi:MAG: hypothetical protein ACI8WT_003168 [Clostridium sp.]|jgi:hypothetical protein